MACLEWLDAFGEKDLSYYLLVWWESNSYKDWRDELN